MKCLVDLLSNALFKLVSWLNQPEKWITSSVIVDLSYQSLIAHSKIYIILQFHMLFTGTLLHLQ